MTSGGVLVVLFLLGIGGLSATTLVVAVRGGRGPGDPPASRPFVDPGGFPVLSRPRGMFEGSHRRRGRAAVVRIAAGSSTARDSRTARPMSSATAGRPFPGAGRTSTRLP